MHWGKGKGAGGAGGDWLERRAEKSPEVGAGRGPSGLFRDSGFNSE